MKINEIYSELIYNKNIKQLNKLNNELEKKIRKTNSIEEQEELYFLLIISKIKWSHLENISIKKMILKYINILEKIETSKKCKKNRLWIYNKKDYSLIVFYNTIISRLNHIEKNYFDAYSSDFVEDIKKIKYEYKRKFYYHNKEYKRFISYTLYKWFSWYWYWVSNLAVSSTLILVIFAYIFYIYDLNNPWTLISWFPWFENQLVWTFEYYIYLSTNIFSNLWADWNLAVTPFLRLLFDIEQIIWVIFMWLFIFIMWKKL